MHVIVQIGMEVYCLLKSIVDFTLALQETVIQEESAMRIDCLLIP